LHEGWRRIVAGEVARELGREVLGRRRAGREIQQDRTSLRFTFLWVALADDGPIARLVEYVGELELAAVPAD
jgi:ketosteroid isomerase-like protein